MKKLKTILLTAFIGLWCSFSLFGASIEVTNLKVEYTDKPLGIDVEKPRFSWQMKAPANERGYKQTAYRIVVTDEKGKQMWDTGKIDCEYSHHIEYNGTPLQAVTNYKWEVTVWDQNGEDTSAGSWFETGLMNPSSALEAWDGATWIGGGDDDLPFYSHYFPIFSIRYTLQLDNKKSNRAGFIFGANDKRLMDKNMNLYHLQSGKDEAYIRVELDISELGKADKPARLHVYRVGYYTDDKPDVPFQSFDIPLELINQNNLLAPHDFFISTVYGGTRIWLDGREDANLIARLNLNPVGNSGDFIAFPVVGDIGFYVPEKQKATFMNVEVRNYRDPGNVLYKHPEVVSYSGKTVIFDPSRNSMPILRTTFDTQNKDIAKARLYVTARGIYEMYINGQRIGENYFNPDITQYNKTHMYQTYDVTPQLKKGSNAIGAMLAEGWWSGGATYSGENWNFFGDRQSLLAKLVITYNDGTRTTITSNPDQWRYYNQGPIVYGSFFQGEVYDARLEKQLEGWSTTAYNDNNWKKAQAVSLEGTISKDEFNKSRNTPMTDDFSKMLLVGQFGETVKQIREITARSVEEVRPGVFIYDMGQNMAGIPSIRLTGQQPGVPVTIRFAEVLYPDLPEYKEHTGMLMLENIRGAMAKDIYITKGGNEEIKPRFTFHGYRYLEITGLDTPPSPANVKGIVISSVPELASSYETSNPLVNKLWENITWSTFGNFLSIPTDCPQRNERLGWSGDISVFARTGTYLANMPGFMNRHMVNMRDVQREDGRFADIAPLGGGFGGVLWGSAGITVPWESYLQFGDVRMLEEHYQAMANYITYLETYIDPQTGILTEGNLADWLGPEDQKNDKTALWEAYFIYDLELMSRIATILGKESDAERYRQACEKRKSFYRDTYIQTGTLKSIHSGSGIHNDRRAKGEIIDTQTSYVLPLVFDIYTEDQREKAVANLVETIRRTNTGDIGTICPPNSLMTGFIGTAWISKALSDNGYTDVAYDLLQNTSYPSWLYSVEQGATTIWERLNSYTHTDGFGGNNSMNSFNHYSFGAVGGWMYANSLGIERDADSPAFKHFILAPEPDPTGKMTFARGHYDSLYGRIESSWEKKGDAYIYRFTVPANTTATLLLPATSVDEIKENGQSVANDLYADTDNGKIVMKLQSGKYEFKVIKK